MARHRKLERPLTSKIFVRELLDRTRQRDDVLGDLCRFRVQGVEISPEDLDNLLEKHKLSGWEPVDIRQKTAARKAITRIRPKLEDPDSDLRVIVRPVHTDEPNIIRYAIVDEVTDHTDLDFSTRNQVVFDTKTGTMEFTKTQIPEIVEEFEYLCSVYTDPELRLMVNNVVTKHGAVGMNDRSGMFFMGHPTKEIVDSLVGLFKDLREYQQDSGSCYFQPIGIIDDEDNRKAMGEAFMADIKLDLQHAKEMLEGAKSGKGKHRNKSVNAALERFREAKGKADLYKSILELNIDTIVREVDEADRKAGELVVTIAKETEETPKETQV